MGIKDRGLSPEAILLELSDYIRWGLRRYSAETILRDKRILYRMKKEGLLDAEQSAVVNWILNYNATAATRHVMMTAYLRWLRYLNQKPDIATLQAYKDLHRLRERKLARIPSLDVVIAVISAIRPSQSRNFYHLIAETGLRFGEAMRLRWSQVDFEGHRLIIEQSEKRSEGSILPLSERAIQILEDQRRRVPTGPGDPVFRVTRRVLLRALSRAKTKLSYLQGAELVNAKNLRHLYATRLYAMTKDLVYVQRMLRHRTILTTQRYVHMVVSRKAYDVKAVPLNDVESIKTLLAEGYEYVAQNKNVMFLRRLKE